MKTKTQKPQAPVQFPVLFPAILMALNLLFPAPANAGNKTCNGRGCQLRAEQVPSRQQIREYKRKTAKAKRSRPTQNVNVTVLNLLRCEDCSKAKMQKQMHKLNRMLVQRQRDYRWLLGLYKRLNRRMVRLAAANADRRRCNDNDDTNNSRLLVLLGQLIEQMKQNGGGNNNGDRLNLAQLSSPGNTSNVTNNNWSFLLNLRVEIYLIFGVMLLGLLGMFRLNLKKMKLIINLKQNAEGHEEQLKSMQRQIDIAKRNEKTALDRLADYERNEDHREQLRSKDAEIDSLKQQLERSDDTQKIAVLKERVSHLAPKSVEQPERTPVLPTVAPSNTERWFTQPMTVNVNLNGEKANGAADKPLIVPASR